MDTGKFAAQPRHERSAGRLVSSVADRRGPQYFPERTARRPQFSSLMVPVLFVVVSAVRKALPCQSNSFWSIVSILGRRERLRYIFLIKILSFQYRLV
jgi:hypothetical protein